MIQNFKDDDLNKLQKKLDAAAIYTLKQNIKLSKYGMAVINGKATTVDQHLKK